MLDVERVRYERAVANIAATDEALPLDEAVALGLSE
jgi:hypothetical protein